MPRFYSAAWVEAFNDALADLPAEVAAGEPGRSVRVAQVVGDAPAELTGETSMVLTAVLELGDGRLSLRCRSGPFGHGVDESADVTVFVTYSDLAELSSGALDPAAALAAGRIRVRGDLSALAAVQALVGAAQERLGPLRAATTY